MRWNWPVDRKLIRQVTALSTPFPGFYGKKVGAIAATEDGEVLSFGYNQSVHKSKKTSILCAVESMVQMALREHKSLYGSIVYLTEPPCAATAKAIWEVGACRVVCPQKNNLYRATATRLLAKLGVTITKYS